MPAAVAAAAIVAAASLALGQALLRPGRRRGDRGAGWDPLAAPLGFAALLVVCTLAAKLPGRAGAAVVAASGAVLVAVLASGAFSPGGERRAPGRSGAAAPLAALAAALAAAIPFLVSDRVGVLGVALVNDDMANHLLIADWVQHGSESAPAIVDDGYPLGPHSLAATLAELLGTGLVEAFAGITLAIAAIGALTAFAALGNLPLGRRTLAAPLAALPYLGAAYLVQGAFKEPIQAILLVAFALLLARIRPKVPVPARAEPSVEKAPRGGTESTLARLGPVVAAVPFAVLLAASVYNYSFPGLLWLVGAAALWWLASAVTGPPSSRATSRARLAGAGRAALATLRRAAPVAALALGLAALLTLPDWGRIAEFTGFGAFAPSGDQTGFGNLRQSISPLEALGVWPSGEFRLAPADARIPAAAFYLGGLLAAAALALGAVRVLARRREEPGGVALLAALGAAAVVYIGAAIAGTPYTSAKALAIAAPPVMLVSLRALLARDPATPTDRDASRFTAAVATLTAVAFVAAAALSSFLVLRQAPVSPPDHPDELAGIRTLVRGDPVLFLGRDDFIAWHLRGAPVSTQVKNFFSTDRVPARIDPPDGEKFDFDAVTPRTLDRFEWVLTTSSRYASDPPPNFRLAERTPSYALWKRSGPTRPREALAEGAAPGATLDCTPHPARPRTAAVWPTPPLARPASGWRPEATIAPATAARQRLRLPPGRWEPSLAYDSPRALEVRVRVEGADAAPRAGTLPANLDFRGPTPPFPVLRPGGAGPLEIALDRPSAVEVEVELEPAPLAGRLLGATGEAHLRELYLAPTAAVKTVHGDRACGEYVDWVRLPPAGDQSP